MIACPRCSKENQDHYKFCLGCGAELPRPAAQSVRPDSRQTGAPPAQPIAGWAPAPAPLPTTLTCSNCQSQVPRSFRFCGTCGHDMTQEQKVQEAVQVASAPKSNPTSTPESNPTSKGKLVMIRPDGSEGESIALGEETTVGRSSGGLFSQDTFLSPQHAQFTWKNNGFVVHDLNSLNGVYLRMQPNEPQEIQDGSVFRVGQEIIRYESFPEAKRGPSDEELMGSPLKAELGRIVLMIGPNITGNAYCISADGLMLGRERGDIIFPDDGYVSGLHCRVHGEEKKIFLTDLGSSNGTFIRLTAEAPISRGAHLLIGQQLFRIDY